LASSSATPAAAPINEERETLPKGMNPAGCTARFNSLIYSDRTEPTLTS
jgi:hypothetical protein